ncbi:hypothetical protein N7490_009202 [Penicillium lividum]|nr:hypothetical protein N7490_009202 [Penicillium lividum]
MGVILVGPNKISWDALIFCSKAANHIRYLEACVHLGSSSSFAFYNDYTVVINAMDQLDVLIIGAGPTGLVLAL